MFLRPLAFTVLLLAAPAGAASLSEALAGYQAAMKVGDDAFAAGHLEVAKQSFESARSLEPQLPQPWLKLAHVAARKGDRATAISLLEDYASMHKLLDLSTEADFASLRTSRDYVALNRRFKENAAPLCRCTVTWRGKPDDFFIAEGLAKDGSRLFIASVKSRRIVVLEHNVQRDFATLPGTFAPFGIFADRARGQLLVSAAELRPGGTAPDRNGLLRYDLKTGALLQTIAGPKGAQIGDLALAPDGTVYLSDSTGPLFRVAPNGTALEEISHDFISPQGMVVSPDGKALLIADYSAGLMRFDLATRDRVPVIVPRGVTTVTMDGVARLADGTFVATQNNIAPVRIVHFALSKDWSRLLWMKMLAINTPDAADPSLVAADGNKAYAVGLAQWSSLAGNGVDLKPPHRPWEVLQLRP